MKIPRQLPQGQAAKPRQIRTTQLKANGQSCSLSIGDHLTIVMNPQKHTFVAKVAATDATLELDQSTKMQFSNPNQITIKPNQRILATVESMKEHHGSRTVTINVKLLRTIKN